MKKKIIFKVFSPLTEWLARGTVPEQRRNVIDKYKLPFSKEELDAAFQSMKDQKLVKSKKMSLVRKCLMTQLIRVPRMNKMKPRVQLVCKLTT